MKWSMAFICLGLRKICAVYYTYAAFIGMDSGVYEVVYGFQNMCCILYMYGLRCVCLLKCLGMHVVVSWQFLSNVYCSKVIEITP